MFSDQKDLVPEERSTGLAAALGFTVKPPAKQKIGREIEKVETSMTVVQIEKANLYFEDFTETRIKESRRSEEFQGAQRKGVLKTLGSLPKDVQTRIAQMQLAGDPARSETVDNKGTFLKKDKKSGDVTTPEKYFHSLPEDARLQLTLENVSAAHVAVALSEGLVLPGTPFTVDLATLCRGSRSDNLIRASFMNGKDEKVDFNLGLDQFATPEGWDPTDLDLDLDEWVPDFSGDSKNDADVFACTFHKHCSNLKQDKGDDDTAVATLGILDVTGMNPKQVEKMRQIVAHIEKEKNKSVKTPMVPTAYNFVFFDFTLDPPILLDRSGEKPVPIGKFPSIDEDSEETYGIEW